MNNKRHIKYIHLQELEFLYSFPALKEKGFKDCLDSLMGFCYVDGKGGIEDWEKSREV